VLFRYTLDTLIFGEAMDVHPAVPEPSTWALLASGLGLLLAWRSTTRKQPRAGAEMGALNRAPIRPETFHVWSRNEAGNMMPKSLGRSAERINMTRGVLRAVTAAERRRYPNFSFVIEGCEQGLALTCGEAGRHRQR
jgi:hypothetical protein